MALKVLDIVKDNTARMLYYRHQVVYYSVLVPGENIEYSFPVPLEDVQDATLHCEEKAMLLMRYIRKALKDGTFVKVI